jgi:hypothetical protein
MSRKKIEEFSTMFGDVSMLGDPESVDTVSGDPETFEFNKHACCVINSNGEMHGL